MSAYRARWNKLYPTSPPPTSDEFGELVDRGLLDLDADGKLILTPAGWAALDAKD